MTHETLQKKLRCPLCDGLKTKKVGRHGKHIRIYCHDCGKKITLNHKQQKAEQLLSDHLNRNSFRIMEREEVMGRKTICSAVNQLTDELIHSNDLTRILQLQNYSGILLVDGKHLPVKATEVKREAGLIPYSKKRRGKTKGGLVAIPFMDYGTHDIPVYEIALSENKEDIKRGFEKLKKLGYPLKVIVCDESMGEIAAVAKEVFPDVIIQTCLKHYSSSIDRVFKINGVKRKLKALQSKLDKLGSSVLISTHRHDIEKARKIVNEMANLEFRYQPLIEMQSIFQEIFWGAKTMADVERLEDELNVAVARVDKNYPDFQKIHDRYQNYYDKRDQIIASVKYPELDIPRTTNLIEGFNSTTLEIRLSSIRGFEKTKTAENYINALILKRRFQKFTDCKGKFKPLNGTSPLQIAQAKNTMGFDFNNPHNWINFCRKLNQKTPK